MQQLPGALRSLEGPLNHYGYLGVGIAIFAEDFGLPLPGETILVLGAAYAGSGRLSIAWVVLIGVAAATLGDNVGYLIGRTAGTALLRRYGRYVLLTEHRLATIDGYFARYGARIVVVARFVEGLRQANGLIAGATEMPWRRFLVANLVGAVLWVGVWSSVGYLAGNHLDAVYRWAERSSIAVGVVAGVIVVALIGRVLWRRRR